MGRIARVKRFQRNYCCLEMPYHWVVLRFLVNLGTALVDHLNSQFEILAALLRRCLTLRLFYTFGCFSQFLVSHSLAAIPDASAILTMVSRSGRCNVTE